MNTGDRVMTIEGNLVNEGQVTTSSANEEFLTLEVDGNIINKGELSCNVIIVSGGINNINGNWTSTTRLIGEGLRKIEGAPLAGEIEVLDNIQIEGDLIVGNSLNTNGHNLTMSPSNKLQLRGANQDASIVIFGGAEIWIDAVKGLFYLDNEVTFECKRVVVTAGTHVRPAVRGESAYGHKINNVQWSVDGDLLNMGFIESGEEGIGGHGHLEVIVTGSVFSNGTLTANTIHVTGGVSNYGTWRSSLTLAGGLRVFDGLPIEGNLTLTGDTTFVNSVEVFGVVDTKGYQITMPKESVLMLHGFHIPSDVNVVGGSISISRTEGDRTVDLLSDIFLTATTVTVERFTTVRAIGSSHVLSVRGKLVNRGYFATGELVKFNLFVDGPVENYGVMDCHAITGTQNILNEGHWPAYTKFAGQRPRNVTGSIPIEGFVEMLDPMKFEGNVTFAGIVSASGKTITMPNGSVLELRGPREPIEKLTVMNAVVLFNSSILEVKADFVVTAEEVILSASTNVFPASNTRVSMTMDAEDFTSNGRIDTNHEHGAATTAAPGYMYIKVTGDMTSKKYLVANLVTVNGDLRNDGVWLASTQLNGTQPRKLAGITPVTGLIELLTDVEFVPGNVTLAGPLQANGHRIVMSQGSSLSLLGSSLRSSVEVVDATVVLSRAGQPGKYIDLPQDVNITAPRIILNNHTILHQVFKI